MVEIKWSNVHPTLFVNWAHNTTAPSAFFYSCAMHSSIPHSQDVSLSSPSLVRQGDQKPGMDETFSRSSFRLFSQPPSISDQDEIPADSGPGESILDMVHPTEAVYDINLSNEKSPKGKGRMYEDQPTGHSLEGIPQGNSKLLELFSAIFQRANLDRATFNSQNIFQSELEDVAFFDEEVNTPNLTRGDLDEDSSHPHELSCLDWEDDGLYQFHEAMLKSPQYASCIAGPSRITLDDLRRNSSRVRLCNSLLLPRSMHAPW
ncbi:hypothetical protein BDZ97DRAFT_669922 [Flammula alnicola]|nr:hypothetical protein BDZ97DRAFT_669922 [Flammula alnicola]